MKHSSSKQLVSTTRIYLWLKKTKNSLGEEKSLSAKMGDAYPKYSERNKYSEENE